jgi:hypothetical protein
MQCPPQAARSTTREVGSAGDGGDGGGVSKSSLSAEAIAASEEQLHQLCERRLDGLDILVIYFQVAYRVAIAHGPGGAHALQLVDDGALWAPQTLAMLGDWKTTEKHGLIELTRGGRRRGAAYSRPGGRSQVEDYRFNDFGGGLVLSALRATFRANDLPTCGRFIAKLDLDGALLSNPKR